MSARKGMTRRQLLRGASLTTLGAAVSASALRVARAGPAAPPPGAAEELGPGVVSFALTVNGKTRTLQADVRTTLLRALRDHLDVTGPKEACDRGACGACTVLLDGMPVNACLMLALDARGRAVTTAEGLGTPSRMHPVQRAFVEQDALMCGFCTPGLVVSVAALLERKAEPSLDDVRHAVSGNLCRCGTYPKVFEAALSAARARRA